MNKPTALIAFHFSEGKVSLELTSEQFAALLAHLRATDIDCTAHDDPLLTVIDTLVEIVEARLQYET